MKIVILAGGAGTRLWPMSTEAKPKQFQNIVSSRSMLQETFDRISFVDSKDILLNPRDILSKLCTKIDVVFSEEMLSWSKGKRDTDGIWADYWYKNVVNSTGFNIYNEKDEDVPSKYLDLYEDCSKIYDELSKHKIT